MLTAKARDDWIPTRQTLLERLKDLDDQQSWQDFYNTYRRLIYNAAVKAGLTDTEAQEVVQETVIVVSKKMPSFRYDPAIGSFKSWLLNTVRWRIGDQFRARKNAVSNGHQATDTRTATVERIPDSGMDSFDKIWDEEWSQHAYRAAIDRVKLQISDKQFQIFHLYVMKELPVTEVSERLGVSAGQVYLAKNRVMKLIKEELKNLETAVL